VSVCVDTSITLSQVTQADAGVYQCIAINVVGSMYATAVLTVRPPTSTSQSVTRLTVSVTSPRPSRMYQM